MLGTYKVHNDYQVLLLLYETLMCRLKICEYSWYLIILQLDIMFQGTSPKEIKGPQKIRIQ